MNWKKKAALFIPILIVVIIVWFWDSSTPTIQIKAPDFVNLDSQLEISVADSYRGIRRVQVELIQNGNTKEALNTDFGSSFLPWTGTNREFQTLLAVKDFTGSILKEGEFEVAVTASDQPNLGFFSRTTRETRKFILDTIPPTISPVSGEHYIRQGGSEAILYRLSEDGESGVRVGENTFIGYPLPDSDDNSYIALFAVSHVQTVDVDISLWAKDQAGNESRAPFWCRTSPGRFRSRRINITDQFIAKVSPEILSRSPEIQAQSTPLDTFLEINRTLRTINNQKIIDITTQSEGKLLWSEPFLQLSNSSVEANFADFRRYYYQDRQIDEQTHLGFDLASLLQSSVEASNSGRVVFAEYFGIYGNTVIIDHGLGLFSLYGHLSAIDVSVGDLVNRGQSLGKTGQTGLAGGDHLHFSMVIQGIQVNPIEWWDPDWVTNHVLSKYKGY